MEIRNGIFQKESEYEGRERLRIAAEDLNAEYKRRLAALQKQNESLGKPSLKRSRASRRKSISIAKPVLDDWDCFKRVDKRSDELLVPIITFKRASIWLNFNEGHSKAVYRPTKMSRFLSK